MRYHTILYASLLPAAVFAQPSVPIPSVAHHSGVSLGRNSNTDNSTHPGAFPTSATVDASPIDIKYHQPTAISTGLPPKQSANVTGVYTGSFDAPRHHPATGKPHELCKKPTGSLHRTSTISSQPTRAVNVVYSSTGIPGEFGKPIDISSSSTNTAESLASSTGRSPKPVAKGSSLHFPNGTTILPSQQGTAIPHISSSGFAIPTGSGHVYPTGASSGHAKPTAAVSFVTFSTFSTPTNTVSASVSMGLNSTISTSVNPSTGSMTSTISIVPTTLATKASSQSPVASTGLVTSTGLASPSSRPERPGRVVIPRYHQCGGMNFKGKGTCARGSVCKKWNPYYHQCVDKKLA